MKIKSFTLLENEKIEKNFYLDRENYTSIPMEELQKIKDNVAIKKSQQISLKINNSDFENIRARASEQGFKYQSVIKALIHQYATGKITI